MKAATLKFEPRAIAVRCLDWDGWQVIAPHKIGASWHTIGVGRTPAKAWRDALHRAQTAARNAERD